MTSTTVQHHLRGRPAVWSCRSSATTILRKLLFRGNFEEVALCTLRPELIGRAGSIFNDPLETEEPWDVRTREIGLPPIHRRWLGLSQQIPMYTKPNHAVGYRPENAIQSLHQNAQMLAPRRDPIHPENDKIRYSGASVKLYLRTDAMRDAVFTGAGNALANESRTWNS